MNADHDGVALWGGPPAALELISCFALLNAQPAMRDQPE